MAVICLQQKQKRISSYAMLAQMVEVFTCFQLWQFKAVMVSWSCWFEFFTVPDF